MSFIWFLIGTIGMGSLWAISAWIRKKQARLTWFSGVGIPFTLILSLFTLAWCLSSIWEKEYQAAGAGFVVFGTLSLIGMGLTRRSLQRDSRRAVKKSDKKR
jgi:hypothetical protein